MKATYLIPAGNLPRFAEEVAKLNKRARRLGVPEITFATAHAYFEHEFVCERPCDVERKSNWGADREVTHTIDEDGRRTTVVGSPRDPAASWAEYAARNGYTITRTGRVREHLTLTVEGETPRFAGWEFIGSLSPVPMDNGPPENEVRATPGNSIPAEYRRRVGECDHCGTVRRRTETFVVRHENGDHRMVGRSCIKDFLGHADPHRLAAWAELLATFNRLAGEATDDEWGGFGGGYAEDIWDLETFLAVTAAHCRVDGWLSRGAARERRDNGDYGVSATADGVLEHLGRPPLGGEARREWEKFVAERRPTDADEARGEAAAAWAKDLSPDGEGLEDYLYNVNLIARSGLVRRKSAGIAASIIAAYDREVERRKRTEARGESKHVGEVGKRTTLTLTLHKVITCEGGMYDPSYLHIMSDEAGNDVKWFASDTNDWFEVGSTVRCDATVKKHDEYRGRPYTLVNRVNPAKPPKVKKTRKGKVTKAETPVVEPAPTNEPIPF